jgi:hypothetical protein
MLSHGQAETCWSSGLETEGQGRRKVLCFVAEWATAREAVHDPSRAAENLDFCSLLDSALGGWKRTG